MTQAPNPAIATPTIAPTEIEQIEQHYTFRNREEVIDFLNQYPFLVPLLLEAPSQIQHYFADAPLILEMAFDPESSSPESDNLVIWIVTDIDPEQTEELVDIFLKMDAEWWGKVEPRSQGKMFIDLE